MPQEKIETAPICRKCNKKLNLPTETASWSNIENEPPVAAQEPPAVRKKTRKNGKRKTKNQNVPEKPLRTSSTSSSTKTSSTNSSTKTSTSVPGQSWDRPGEARFESLEESGPLSQHIETRYQLNEIVATGIVPDHPLCCECTDTLIEITSEQIEELEEEAKVEKEYMVELCIKDKEEDESLEELRAELARLEAEEERANAEFRAVEIEREMVFRERDLMREKEARLKKSLDLNLKGYNLLKENHNIAAQELFNLQYKYGFAEEQIQRLTATDAFERKFNIEVDGPIGKINDKRLGSLPTCEVGWGEINMAWGEVMLTMAFLARTFEFDFDEKYTVVPMGDRAYIEKLGRKTVKLTLHRPKESNAAINENFDKAMIAFLDCVLLFEQAIKSRHNGDFALTYPIFGDGQIYDIDHDNVYRITYEGNNTENWTKALRCMLVDLKQIVDLIVERLKSERRHKENNAQ